MNVAIVGAGLIGARRATSLRDGDAIVVVVDPDESRASQLAELFGAAAAANSREAQRYMRRGDIAVVATTHDNLVPAALPFLESGCHVLLEKPGACSLGELTSLRGICQPNQIVAVGYNHRFHPAIRRLHESARAGTFGPLRSIRARYGHGGRPGYEQEWRMDPQRSGGGELLDQGSHLIDLTRFIAGGFVLSHAELATLYWPVDVEDNVWLIGRAPGDVVASLHASWTEWKNLFSLEAFFTTAKVEVSGLGGSYGPEMYIEHHMTSGFGPPQTTSVQFPPGDASWTQEWLDFCARIEGADDCLGATLADAEAVLGVIAEAYSRDHN